jgi:lysophospholipase L1-like esterase
LIAFSEHQKILFIGDSITDCDRRGYAAPLGDGYVRFVHDFLTARYPELKLSVVNRGMSGDTVRNLAARWQRDVIDEEPDWLSVGIGINDVWRSFGDSTNEAVPINEYEATLSRLLDWTTRSTRAKLILLEPYMIEPNRSQPMRRQMDLYGEVVRRIAAERGAILVPAQAAFDEALRHSRPSDWSPDKVHPNGPGHAVIALAFLRAVGFEL